MNTIVVNTLTAAVSEYDGFAFNSVSPKHAASQAGLFLLGGDSDAGAPIAARIETGKSAWGMSHIKLVDVLFVAVKGEGCGQCHILGEKKSYSYTFRIECNGVSRCHPGRGIRENYLAFGFSNTNGLNFRLDHIEVLLSASKTRRTQ
jgi:hypothetical protein